jgi:Terpene cyclase DEP1
MISLIVHAVLGVLTAIWIVRSNPHIFAKVSQGSHKQALFSRLEIVYLLTGILVIPICWYFNYQFVLEYKTGADNPIWGPGSWQQFIVLGYDNPAAASASVDYTVISLILVPVFTIVDGMRRGIRRPWLFFGFILFATSATAFAWYFAVAERQHRHQQAEVGSLTHL